MDCKSKQLAIVKKLTNITDKNRIVVNEIGWSSRVYIVDNGEIVFKFPRNLAYQKECEHEVSILKLISDYAFNVHIPIVKWTSDDGLYTGLCGIKGKSLTTETVDKLSDAQKREIGTQIGLFLKQLHAIDYKGKSPSNDSTIIEWYQKAFDEKKPILKNYFSENELDTIEELVIALPQKSAKLGIEPVFCHCDLGYNNILITNNLEVGVIDFGDAGIYDKSTDFTGLENDTMLNAAIIAYGDNEILREKIAIRRQLLPLMEMLFLIDKKDKEGIKKSAGKMRNNLSQIVQK